MSRRKKAPAHVNHERWLISYADFITLLFAFFVVMFASSQADRGKAAQMSESFKEAFEGKLGATLATLLGGAPGIKEEGLAWKKEQHEKPMSPDQVERAARLVQLAPSLRLLEARLKPEIDGGMLNVSMEARGIVISLRQAAFFPSGQDAIDESTYPTIGKLAEVILAVPNKVRLEGHTDNVPIHNARYRSNWELSSARGVTMLEILTTRFQVPGERLSVGGYADTIPIASNEAPEGRARNRRVDMVILNENGIKGEPSGLNH